MSNSALIELNITRAQDTNVESELSYTNISMPEEFMGLVLKCGTHWHAYVKAHFRTLAPGLQRAFGPDGTRGVAEFYDLYPSWDTVSKHLGPYPDTDWDEKQHDLFKAALNWFQGQAGFSVSWTYINPLIAAFNDPTFVRS